MCEVFHPSLIISLGPSSKKTLLYTQNLMSNLEAAFLNLIHYYEVKNINEVSKDIQEIIETKLLAAKHINKLVDMGFKLRSDNSSYVRLNIYFLWEACKNDISIFEVIKLLSKLSYGNTDKNQHSGVCLFIIPIFNYDCINKEKYDTGVIEELGKVKEYLCLTYNMLRLDSKIYLLQNITYDGTRITKEELLYIAAFTIYLNIIPSTEPPLSNYISRMLMNERCFKVGTIGISILGVLDKSLEEEFSLYLACKIINHAIEYEDISNISNSECLNIMNWNNETKAIMHKLNYEAFEGGFEEEKIISKKIIDYPEHLKSWKDKAQNYINNELKNIVNKETKKYKDNIIKNIDIDINEMLAKSSLKEALNYLTSVLEKLDDKLLISKTSEEDSFINLDIKLKNLTNRCANLVSYVKKGIFLAAILIIILICFYITHKGLGLVILGIGLIFSLIAFLAHGFKVKKLHVLINDYKNDIIKIVKDSLINIVENSFLDELEMLKEYIGEKKIELVNIMEKLEEVKDSLKVKDAYEEKYQDNLAVELLTYEDRLSLYTEKSQSIKEVYNAFINKLGNYKDLGNEDLKEKLIEFSSEVAKGLGEMDFYDYFQFKYKGNYSTELSKWIYKGLVKSKYLLQYINTNFEEEHIFFMTTSKGFKLLRQEDKKLNNINFSPIVSKYLNKNLIAIVRVCLGIDFTNIITFRNEASDG